MILTELPEWKALLSHYESVKDMNLRTVFEQDSHRADEFSVCSDDLLFDYSKNLITSETFSLLIKLAEAAELPAKISSMFSGSCINTTEHRPALHTALRNLSGNPVFAEGKNVMPEILAVREKMKRFSDGIRSGERKGFSGKPLKNIVNIGIGGSHLGPAMAVEALEHWRQKDLRFFFVSNIDGADISGVLNQCSPEETLFIVSSKTFTTQETMTNAETAQAWLLKASGSMDAVSSHFAAVSANTERAAAFGISPENIFAFWDWVGGRYSMTSAIGLSVMTAVGYENFMSMLKGFYAADLHFLNTELNRNIPAVMGLLGIWYNNFFGWHSTAVLPYSHCLQSLPAYLQQADMESSGKSRDLSGRKVDYATGPVLWGAAGTNGQHSFYQLLHHGTTPVPCDFIGFVNSPEETGDHQDLLMANFFAQTRALAFGRTEEELKKAGVSDDILFHRIFPGSRPSNSLLFSDFNPEVLGKIIAIYEHRIFTQGAVWNINSFDQWGVELGKVLAKEIYPGLKKDTGSAADSSTDRLLAFYRKNRSVRR